MKMGAPGASPLGTCENTDLARPVLLFLNIWRVAQVPDDVSRINEDGCPRCLAFGHLGNLGSQPAFSR